MTFVRIAGSCALALALCLSAAAVAAAHPAQPPAPEAPPPGESGLGRLLVADRSIPMPYQLSALGDLVDLDVVASALGAEVEIGPFGQGTTLHLGDQELILGADSPVVTIDQEILPLSRAPVAAASGLLVPVDFFSRIVGDRIGWEFLWSRSDRILSAARRQRGALQLSADAVHIAGVTTVVLQLSESAHFRVERPAPDRLDLVFPRDAVTPVGPPLEPDRMLRDLEVRGGRVTLRLADGVEAAEPYRVERGGRAQVVVDLTRRRARGGGLGRRDVVAGWQGMRIVLDPGHGGAEVGAVGPGGTLEKDLTLLLARRLRRALESRLPVRVILTRDADVALGLETRAALANQNEADLFLSIHLNSSPGGGGRGAETYFLDQSASDPQAASTAEFENRAAADASGLDLMLWDLAQSRSLAASQRLAKLIQAELNEALNLRDRGVKQAPFRVLAGAAMPAVLVELGFLSNAEEEAKLLDPGYRARLTDALVAAVARFRSQSRERDAPSGGAQQP